jgi:ASPIC and UnbV/FG-GAP-like repeat
VTRVAAVLLAAVLLPLAACSTSPDDDAGGGATTGDVRFVDVAREVGLDFRHGAFRWGVSDDPAAMMAGGLCWLDFDADGWLDLFVVNTHAQDEAPRWRAHGGLPTSALYHNEGGTFVDVSRESGAEIATRGTGCVAADLDVDGDTDLYVTGADEGVLLWNDGDGTFRDGTEAAGVAALGWYAGAAVGDVNRDGRPDLFLAGYASLGSPIEGATLGFPNTHSGVRDLLYLSDGAADAGGVAFTEVGRQAGLEVVGFEYGLGALFSDLDLDGDLDLYVANDTRPNRLYDNVPWPGGAAADPAGLGFRFEELAGRAGVADPNAGMGVAGADFDGDGRCDLFVTNARGQVHGVYQSQPPSETVAVDPSFVDVRGELGPDLGAATGWGVSWADIDLDTDVDLIVANGDIPVTDLEDDADTIDAFVNLAADGRPGRFRDDGGRLGLTDVGAVVGRGSAAADYDNDGDLDVAVNDIGGPLVLLENRGAAGHWLEVELDGFAPGAMVSAVLPDGSTLVREVQAGGSYLSSEDPRLHFGLGPAGEVAELSIVWPGGALTRRLGVAADRVVRVERPLPFGAAG